MAATIVGGEGLSRPFSARGGAIDERLIQLQPPAFTQVLRQPLQSLFELSAPHPLLESAVTGLPRRIFLRHLAPLRSGAQNPQHVVEQVTRLLPRTAPVVRTALRSQHRF